jgi:hypothetical protein
VAYRYVMADDHRIIEDGSRPGRPTKSKAPSWMVLTVGLIVGLGLGVVLFSSTSRVNPGVELTTTPESGFAGPTLPPIGISGLVPEFPDALVALSGVTGEEDGLQLQHILWPSHADHVVRDLAVKNIRSASLDVAGTSLAVWAMSAEPESSDLYAGRPSGLVALSSDVTSFAWHDSKPGFLAFTSVADGVWSLNKIQGPPEPSLVVSDVVEDGTVVAWGEWGFAIQTLSGAPTVWLLDPAGRLVSIHRGLAHGSHPSGQIAVIEDDELTVLASTGGILRVVDRAASVGPVSAAAFSPDGARVAILGQTGLKIVPITDGSEVSEYEPIPGWPQVVWSSDSRFVLVPGPRGITVIDTATNVLAEALPEFGVIAVGVVDLMDS